VDPINPAHYGIEDGNYPDPYTAPHRYMQARRAELQQAHRENAEAFVFVAAETLHGRWPTAHRVVFDRTAQDADPRKWMEFLRIEDCDGTTLATQADMPESEASDRDGVVVALHYLWGAEGDVNTAGGIGAHRPWSVVRTYSFQDDAAPPYLCTFTLPPAVRPEGDRTGLAPRPPQAKSPRRRPAQA
jgi:hypothetical protein